MEYTFQLLIDGRWCDSETQETIPVFAPATGDSLGTVQAASITQVGQAIRSAASVKELYRNTEVFQRYGLLMAIADEMEAEQTRIAEVLCLEQGKPYASEALPEVVMVVEVFRQTAADLLRLTSEVISSTCGSSVGIVKRQADGLYVVITPWNYPLDMPALYIAPGLAMGNVIVFKPASSTPLSAALMAQAIDRAIRKVGLPPQIFQFTPGSGRKIGEALVSDPLVDGVAFIGETKTGMEIQQKAGFKKVILELGGNGPSIVLDDADLKRAAQNVAAGFLENCGQICSGSERILVQKSVKNAFLQELRVCFEAARMGDPMQPETTLGPMNSESGVQKLERHVRDAVEKGAALVCGGQRAPQYGSPLFFQPTILDNVIPGMEVCDHETFGPVAPIITFETDDEALAFANSGGYGLQMAVFTSSMSRARRFANQLRSGLVSVNVPSAYFENQYPFGGAVGSLSGGGRVGGKYGLEQMSHTKTIMLDTFD